MDEEFLLEFFEADMQNYSRRIERRGLRDQIDPFQLSETEFIQRYRLSKQLACNLCDELRPMMREPTRSTDLTVEAKVLTALSFFATGSYQRPTGDIAGHSMAQQTVSTTIAKVTACLNTTEMRRKYIVFPRTREERDKTRTEFYSKFGVPGVLGCIDCTHVAIVRPRDNEERYYCRKQYHSLNVQMICDAYMNVTSVDSSYGGASHDSFIWNNHPIREYMENLNESTWLLGDSGYPLRKYLLTPVVDAAPNTPERHYTDMHVRTRNVIERTIGLLKARFRCLLVHRVLHYTPEVAASIVNACVVLHNMCNKVNLPVEQLGNSDMLHEAQMQVGEGDLLEHRVHQNNIALQQGVEVRNRLISRLWQSRGP